MRAEHQRLAEQAAGRRARGLLACRKCRECVQYVCGCGRKIRVSPTVLAAGPITCGMCGVDFAPERDDHDEQAGVGMGEGAGQ